MNKKYFFLATILLVSSCVRVPEQIEPKLDYAVQDRYLMQLPSPFSSLTEEEKRQDWGKEYRVGISFARELDLYQAITAFKRALFLLPKEEKTRKVELEYEILLCYYIGKKYSDVIHSFEQTDLYFVDIHFPAYQDLLLILFDSYTQLKEKTKADRILEYLNYYYPEKAERLTLSRELEEANLNQIQVYAQKPNYAYLQDFLTLYNQGKKSVPRAQLLNSLIPGAGYFYVGQKQSALTAFLLNGLFMGASYYFFHKGNIPAGVIFTGFEAGWYFGGIYGAGEEAKFYNERLYEHYATPLMNQKKLFPILSLQYAF